MTHRDDDSEPVQDGFESAQDDSESAHDDTESERTTIRTGRDFERQYRLDAAEAGRFLIDLGEQLRDGDELTITDDEWELPFRFGEPVELEIDFDGVGDPELEIELELPGRTDEKAPSID